MPDQDNFETPPLKVVVDGVIVDLLDKTKPAGISRTSWANLAIQIGIANAPSYMKSGHSEI